jgi:AbrB family looped-hinge helix DNA binding protein
MPTATVTAKGQITIPAEVRKALNLKPGDKIDIFEVENGRFALSARNKSIRDLKGCVPKLDYVPTIEQINEAIGAAVAESVLKSLDRTAEDTSKGEAA